VYVFGPTVHAGTNRVPVTLEQTIPASPIAGVAWSQRVESTVAFEGVSSIEECMTPVDNRDIRRRIVNGLTISASRPGSGEGWDRLTKLTFHFEPEWEPSAVDYTIAVRITIEHEGRVLAEHRDNETYLRRFSDLELPDRDIGEDPAWGPLLIKDGTGINLDGVIIRIRPDPLGALAYLAYDKFWSGEIILDARDVIAVEPHPYDME
jgi:hypothetical protein